MEWSAAVRESSASKQGKDSGSFGLSWTGWGCDDLLVVRVEDMRRHVVGAMCFA